MNADAIPLDAAELSNNRRDSGLCSGGSSDRGKERSNGRREMLFNIEELYSWPLLFAIMEFMQMVFAPYKQR